MSLRHALLALLEAGPMTGYELAKQFDQSVAYVWHAPHSQIYPELRRLEQEELVLAHELPRGPNAKATKRAYALTQAGADELTRWVAEVQAPPSVRDVAYLKATYFEYGSPEVIRRQFTEHLAHFREQQQRWERHVEQLRARATVLLQRRLGRAPDEAHDAIVGYKVHVYWGLVERAKVEIAWAERGLRLVDELAAGGEDFEQVLYPAAGE
ncbi:MAG TPA: PadR family transcriptional regulator [Pseudonocardiaceae bacterium]|jgi:DNA-binding PadR family transcriptional regulator|nr:PadR family transcriptional regulator [Pseudonocardiaceae bacterium]